MRIASHPLAALPHDCAWRVELHEHKPLRSQQQNRFLFGVVYETILKQGGESHARVDS